MQAALGKQLRRGIGRRRPERLGKQPRVSSDVLAVDVQLLPDPQFRESHGLEGCFQRLMKIQGRERDRLLPFPSLALFP